MYNETRGLVNSTVMLYKACDMKCVISICILVVSFVVKADDVDKLISLTGVEESIEKAYEECRKGSSLLMAEELTFEAQSKRLGIGRDHESWAELAAIYEEFFSVACEYASPEDARKIWREIYGSSLTASEVKELVAFYSRPLGKKVKELDLKANAELQEVISRRYAEQTHKAQRIFEFRMEEFLEKLKAEQHNKARKKDASCRSRLFA